MAEYLEYKSKAISICNHNNFDVTEFIPKFKPDKAKLETAMNRAIAARGIREEGNRVESGDLVELCCESLIAKYNKPDVMVNVGKGLMNEVFETELIGMVRGQSKTIIVDGETVHVTVKKIMHTVLPKLSEIELKEIRKECIDRQIDRLIDAGEEADMASAMICSYVAENSKFQMDGEELSQVEESIRSKLAGAEQLDEATYEFMIKIHMNSYKTALIGYEMAKKSGLLVTIEEYEKTIEGYRTYFEGMSADDAKKEYTLDEFMLSKYADIFIKHIDKYVSDEFKKALNEEY